MLKLKNDQVYFMNLLTIKKYGDPILREKCEEVKNFDQNIRLLYKGMLRFLKESRNGVGLAASQVGSGKQIIVIDAYSAGGYNSHPDDFLCLANPKIVKKSATSNKIFEECLSLPGISVKVKRAIRIEVEAWSLQKNKLVRLEAEGFLARVLQHEIDHLRGILIIDYLSPWRKSKTVKKLEKIIASVV